MRFMIFVLLSLASAFAFASMPDTAVSVQDLTSVLLDPHGLAMLPALAAIGNIQLFRDKRGTLLEEMRAIVDAATSENRDLTEDEEKTYDAKKAEFDKLGTRIKQHEDLETMGAELDRPNPTAAERTAIERGRNAPGARKDFENLGEFLATVVRNPNDQRLVYVEGTGAQGEQRMDDGPSGGFAIPMQFRETLLRVDPQEQIIAGRATNIEPGTPPDAEITMPALDQTGDVPKNVYGGVAVNWIEEGATKQETEFKLRQVSLRPKEVAAHIPMTDKLLRNWQAASSVAENLLRGAMAAATEDTYLNGSGVGKPLGILNASATITVNRKNGNKVQTEDVFDMLSKILMRGGTPIWLGSQSIYNQLLRLKDEQGRYIWVDNARDGSPGSLMGYQMFWNERSPLLGSPGDLTLLNLPYYLIKQGSGPFVAAGHINDDFVKNKQRLKIFYNVDGQPWLTQPFKQEKGFEVSPFIKLGNTSGSG